MLLPEPNVVNLGKVATLEYFNHALNFAKYKKLNTSVCRVPK